MVGLSRRSAVAHDNASNTRPFLRKADVLAVNDQTRRNGGPNRWVRDRNSMQSTSRSVRWQRRPWDWPSGPGPPLPWRWQLGWRSKRTMAGSGLPGGHEGVIGRTLEFRAPRRGTGELRLDEAPSRQLRHDHALAINASYPHCNWPFRTPRQDAKRRRSTGRSLTRSQRHQIRPPRAAIFQPPSTVMRQPSDRSPHPSELLTPLLPDVWAQAHHRSHPNLPPARA